jgi:hypothetical protein
MEKYRFSYSILQYRYSLAAGEALNVGILFVFPSRRKVLFVSAGPSRPKAIYPDFNTSYFNKIIKFITARAQSVSSTLFDNNDLSVGIKKYIDNNLLLRDSTVLQFSEPHDSVSHNPDPEQVAEELALLLLPGRRAQLEKKPVRRNEAYLVKQFSEFLSSRAGRIEHKIVRNKEISTDKINVRFDFAWQNGTLNLVKPISFDLKEEKEIQLKSAAQFGCLTLLSDYATTNNCRFDLIVCRPETRELFHVYDKALETLNQIPASKRIIEDQDLHIYSEEALDVLLNH